MTRGAGPTEVEGGAGQDETRPYPRGDPDNDNPGVPGGTRTVISSAETTEKRRETPRSSPQWPRSKGMPANGDDLGTGHGP